jgi:hypothetical protein
MAKRLTKLRAKLDRVVALNGLIDARGEEAGDARRVKRALPDRWVNRRGGSVEGFYKAHNAKPGACKVL